MKAATFKMFERVHSWTGLLAGLALFIAFYAGAFTVFHDDIERWQQPRAETAATNVWSDAESLIQSVVTRFPEARKQISISIPGTPDEDLVAYWFDGKDNQQRSSAQMKTAPTASAHEPRDLAEFLYELHYQLAIPEVGIYLMGVVSVIYALALITGVLLYLPGLTRDIFALRAGRNLKRLWQDAHNVIGVLSLPFHIIFAVTGAIFCLSNVALLLFNVLVFKGQLIDAAERTTGYAPSVEARGIKADAMLTPQAVVERARAAVKERGGLPFEADYLRYRNYGDVAATVEAYGDSDGALASSGAVAMNAADGKLLNVQAAGTRDVNHAAYSVMYGMHFGHFGQYTVRWLYFILGISGAFLFYSGNLLWIESRRNRRTTQQSVGSFVMARVTVGICIGTCVGVSAAFLATLIAAVFGATSDGVVIPVFAVTLAACIAWAFFRAPVRAAVNLLVVAAILTAAVPLADVALGIANIRPAILRGDAISLWTAFIALVLAVGFAMLARATAARARNGDSNSVWAGQVSSSRVERVRLPEPS